MEHIGEILKKMQTRTNISREDMDIWSGDELYPEPAGDRNCTICKGGGFVHPRLASGKPDYSRTVPCQCVKMAKAKEQEDRLYRYSNLGALAKCDFESISRLEICRDAGSPSAEGFKKACEAAQAFASEPKGWFILVGPSGSGKTYLAAAIANERIKRGERAFFQTVPELLDHLRSAFAPDSEMSSDELFEKVCNTPLLILDDLGVQASTPWVKEKLDQLLNFRYIRDLPTVVTTSLSIDKFDERTHIRLSNPRLSKVYLLGEIIPNLYEYKWGKGFELQKEMTFKTFDYKRLNLPLEQRQNLEWTYNVAFQYAESPDGWLVMVGRNGCGKTHLAAAIANYRYERGKPALFIVVPEFLDHLRETFSPESKVSYDQLFEAVKSTTLLVLDDFGEQSTTPWAQEKLYQVINYRYNARLATIITTSCSLEQIEPRISSRLVDPRISMVINITAPDYRGDKSSMPDTRNSLRRLKKSRYSDK